MRRVSTRWRYVVAFLLGVTLPWFGDGLVTALTSWRSELPLSPYLTAWTVLILGTAVALVAVAPDRAVTLAIAAGAGGLSAIGLVIILYRLDRGWLLAAWPSALAIGVGLPLVTMALSRVWRRTD